MTAETPRVKVKLSTIRALELNDMLYRSARRRLPLVEVREATEAEYLNYFAGRVRRDAR